MSLRDRWSGWIGASLARRTGIYVLGFGLGTLVLIGLMSFTVTSIAQSLLPSDAKPDDEVPGEVVVPVVTAGAGPRAPRAPAVTPGRRRITPRPGVTPPKRTPRGTTEPTVAEPPGGEGAVSPGESGSLSRRSRANEAQRSPSELPL